MRRLSFANVASTLAVFLILAGATAFAAQRIGKHSVGSKQLRAGAVTAAKLKHNAVTTRKLKKNAVTGVKVGPEAVTVAQLVRGAVTGEKIAANTVTGANIDAPSTPFSQLVARLRAPATVPLGAQGALTVGAYTQAAGEDDRYLGGLTVDFLPSCGTPRAVRARLLLDAVNPMEPRPGEEVGVGEVEDTGGGSAPAQLQFRAGPALPMSRLAPAAATHHTFSVFLEGECASGAGTTVSDATVEAIGTR